MGSAMAETPDSRGRGHRDRSDRDRDPSDRLGALEARIRAARAAAAPPRRSGTGKYTAASLAWRMVLEMVVGVLVGAAMGWGLDSLFGTVPLFLIVFILLGFAAGIRTAMRSADEFRRRQAGGSAEDEDAPGARR